MPKEYASFFWLLSFVDGQPEPRLPDSLPIRSSKPLVFSAFTL